MHDNRNKVESKKTRKKYMTNNSEIYDKQIIVLDKNIL